MMKCLIKCFSSSGNAFVNRLKGRPCTTVPKELLCQMDKVQQAMVNEENTGWALERKGGG